MADLTRLAESLGWTGCRTLVNSGNLVFHASGTSDAQAAALEAALQAKTGRTIRVLVRTGAEMAGALASCPWPGDLGKAVHAFFPFGAAEIAPERYEALRAPGEELMLVRGLVWLRAPEGVGRSKLAAGIDHVVRGDGLTARNLNTLRKLVAIVDAGRDAC